MARPTRLAIYGRRGPAMQPEQLGWVVGLASLPDSKTLEKLQFLEVLGSIDKTLVLIHGHTFDVTTGMNGHHQYQWRIRFLSFGAPRIESVDRGVVFYCFVSTRSKTKAHG